MQYPSRLDYHVSIRNPQVAFRKKDSLTKIEKDLDTNLVAGRAVEKIKANGSKDIWSASGSFAIAFKYETFSPRKIWAIRCFYRTNFEVGYHYRKVLSRLKNNLCRSYFVDFEFLEEGIRVQGNCYPILKMEWQEGDNLKKFLKANLNNQNALKSLANLWLELADDFLKVGIAHGDLQHGNILVVDRFGHLQIKLIDYDSLYFLGDTVDDKIKGLSDYQHPLRKSLNKRCLEIDFFPQLVIYISILALAEDRDLWQRYKVDEREGLLFSRTDFEEPERAEIFENLSQLSPPIAALANQLKKICQIDSFTNIPSLKTILSGDRPLTVNKTINLNEEKAFVTNPLTNSIFSWLKKPDLLSKKAFNSPAKETSISATNSKQESEYKEEKSPIALVTNNSNSGVEKKLKWDPRSYKTTYPLMASESKTAIVKTVNSKATPSLKPTYLLIRDRVIIPIQEIGSKLINSLPVAIDKLKKITQLKNKPKTWTTREVTSQLGCPANWCHKQRYQFPDQFSSGTHYYKDEEGMIQWTKKGVEQLRRLWLQKKADTIPSSLLPTKEVSHRLGISSQRLTQIKAKYTSYLIEGTHYYIDARKRYYWSPLGIKQLEQLLQSDSQKSS